MEAQQETQRTQRKYVQQQMYGAMKPLTYEEQHLPDPDSLWQEGRNADYPQGPSSRMGTDYLSLPAATSNITSLQGLISNGRFVEAQVLQASQSRGLSTKRDTVLDLDHPQTNDVSISEPLTTKL